MVTEPTSPEPAGGGGAGGGGAGALPSQKPQTYGLLPSQLASFQSRPPRQASVQSSLPVPSQCATPACQSLGSPEAQFS